MAYKYLEKQRGDKAAYYQRNKEKILSRAAEHYQRNKEKILAYQRAYSKQNRSKIRSNELRRLYNINLEQYQKLLKNQDGRCAACKDLFQSTNLTHIDHCHRTGKVRSVLCHACNTSLGLLKEDAARIRALAEYVDKVCRDS